jgi:hypothetical protein
MPEYISGPHAEVKLTITLPGPPHRRMVRPCAEASSYMAYQGKAYQGKDDTRTLIVHYQPNGGGPPLVSLTFPNGAAVTFDAGNGKGLLLSGPKE